MNTISVFCRGVVCSCVLGIFAYPDQTQGAASSDAVTPGPTLTATNSFYQALFPWGEPQFTDGGLNCYPRPAWVLAGCQDGGLWITNDSYYGWQPTLGDWQVVCTTNRLLINLDRAQSPTNLWLSVVGVGEPDAALVAGFCNDDLLSVAEPVILRVVDAIVFTNCIDLSRAPSASVLTLSVTSGMVRIFRCALYQELGRSGNTNPTLALLPSNTAVMAPPQFGSSVTSDFANSRTFEPAHASAVASVADTTTNTPGPRTWYVDATNGDDNLYDGRANTGKGNTGTGATAGPKRTIPAALAGVVPGDTIVLAPGRYPGRLKINGIRMITQGRVEL